MTNHQVIKQGHAGWGDLIGKEISFDWSDGWEKYWVDGTFEGTQVYAEDPRYPRYYILIDGGGVSVREDEPVKVTVHEQAGIRVGETGLKPGTAYTVHVNGREPATLTTLSVPTGGAEDR